MWACVIQALDLIAFPEEDHLAAQDLYPQGLVLLKLLTQGCIASQNRHKQSQQLSSKGTRLLVLTKPITALLQRSMNSLV